MDYDIDAFRTDAAKAMTEKEDEDMTPKKLAERLPDAFAILAKRRPHSEK